MSKNNQRPSLHSSELRRKSEKFPLINGMVSLGLLTLSLILHKVRRGISRSLGRGPEVPAAQLPATVATSVLSAEFMCDDPSNDDNLSEHVEAAPGDSNPSNPNADRAHLASSSKKTGNAKQEGRKSETRLQTKVQG